MRQGGSASCPHSNNKMMKPIVSSFGKDSVRGPKKRRKLFGGEKWLASQNARTRVSLLYHLSKPEIEFDVMEEMYVASCMHTCAEKLTF